MCLSLTGHPLFNVRCESNPAFYTRCTILWMGRWSKDGMIQVPTMRLQPILSSTSGSGVPIDAAMLLDQVLHVHNTMIERGMAGGAGGSGATPTKYIAFLETYLKIFDTNQKKKTLQKKHLMGGLKKLVDAAQNVEILSKEAAVKREQAAKKQIEADNALEQITAALAQAAARRGDAEKLQVTLGVHEAKLSSRKAEVAKELAEAQPALDKAKSAVGDIRRDNINEIRNFRMPPIPIRQVLAGVLTLMRQEDLSWANMKKFLGQSSVKEAIVNFDASKITPAIRGAVMKLIKETPDAFDYDRIYHVNVAAAPLAEWVKANLKYSAVLEQIQPLREELEKNTTELKANTDQLDRVKSELKELEAKVQSLKENYGRMTGESEALKAQVVTITETLNAAQSLLGKLDGERSRWDTQVKALSAGLDSLPYNSMLAAGVITYLGGYPEDVRQSTIADWKAKCRITEFDFESFMATESEFLKWKAEGLPSDSLSMQNGLIIINSVQCPYLIDPNTQATEWLKRHLSHGDKPVEAIMQQDPRFITTIELAVRFGKTLIIQEADGVLPLLYPLLRRDLFRQGPRWVVQVGDKAIDYSDTFKLYLVTRDSAPDIPGSAAALINEVNFTVTRSGLEGQLLGVTLEHEKPELEAKKSQLLAEEDKFKIQLDELEKELLEALATSEGNILQNKTLIESLEKTKTQSNNISNALKTAKVIQTDLDQQRDVYRPIARSGSILFFLVGQLSAVNNMYEFSLPAFIRLFNKNLDADGKRPTSATPADEKQRVEKLTVGLKLNVFRYITRSLFKDDRLMFALHLIHCLHPQLFEKREWEFFTGSVVDTDAGDAKSGGAAPLPAWATPDRATPFASFSATFPSLVRAIRLGGGSDEAAWRKWASNPRCESDFPFPVVGSPAEAKSSAPGTVTSFQKLLVLQALRPDRLQSALQTYVCETIGVPSISPPPLNLAKIVEQTQHGAAPTGKEGKKEEKGSASSDVEPILFVATAGSDPTMELEEFAVKRVGKGKFKQMAMGSGQTEGALEALITAQREGSWLCLKNLHLVTSWLPSLEKALKSGTPHPDFRLWLTTEPHQHFPPILLQQSLKITYASSHSPCRSFVSIPYDSLM
jgi:dynein heavy chain 2